MQHAKEWRRERGAEQGQRYGTDWRRLRARHLEQHPLCATCGAVARYVDHKQTIRDAPERRLDPSNLESLCRSCHSRKTALMDGRWGLRKR